MTTTADRFRTWHAAYQADYRRLPPAEQLARLRHIAGTYTDGRQLDAINAQIRAKEAMKCEEK